MEVEKNDTNDIIINAIDASIRFEGYMDSIDFNSYLQDDKDLGDLFEKNNDKIKEAEECCNNFVIVLSEKLIKKIERENLGSAKVKAGENVDEVSKYLINKIFESKKTRIKARQQFKREEEVKLYIDCYHNLHKAFNIIDKKDFYKIKKDQSTPNKDSNSCSFFSKYNWAKVLYYNELAICCSGLVKSSMSLGYAEESISLLEESYPELKTIDKSETNGGTSNSNDSFKELGKKCKLLKPEQIINLYTIALINKGEAERLLREDSSALRTFKRIICIYDKNKVNSEEHNDSYYALLREALIFIDQGRGKEAISCLDKVNSTIIGENDYRVQLRDLEKASALIDQKEYTKAWEKLEYFNKECYNLTFSQRQAKIYKLRLMNEFRKNRVENFQVTDKLREVIDIDKINNCIGAFYDKKKKTIALNQILSKGKKNKIISAVDEKGKKIINKLWEILYINNDTTDINFKSEYEKYEKKAIGLIMDSINRKDGDSFKGACTKLAEFYQLENTDKKNIELTKKALKYFHLYLFESKIFEKPEEIKKVKELVGTDLVDLLNKNGLVEKLNYNEDENYLKSFFDAYIDLSGSSLSDNQNKIIEKLYKRLCDIYQQKEKDIELDKIALKYEKNKKITDEKSIDKNQSTRFIKEAFFENKHGGMRFENIEYQMKKNTEEFIGNIVGKSKIANKYNNKLLGTLTVLRRWNSFTPTLSSSINKSKGGGYFLRFYNGKKQIGIVIDPGFNFLENFFSQGFKIGDIDFVLVSHAHPDHTDDLPALMSLFHEMNGRIGEYFSSKKSNKKNPRLILSSGVYEQYSRIIKSSEEVLKDIIVCDGKDEKTMEFADEKIKIKAFSTVHQDLSQYQSLGFIITLIDSEKNESVIGYTGDIKWRPKNDDGPDYLEHFSNCDIICVHLGSIINILKNQDFCNTFCKEYNESEQNDRCESFDRCSTLGYVTAEITKVKLVKQTHDENHLYLAGLTFFLDSMTKNDKLKTVIISEFGEELKNGIRMDLYKKFNNWFKFKTEAVCLPGDIGLEIDAFTGNVYCHCCKRFVDRAEIVPVPYGKEEAICFVCKECSSVLSTNQIDLLLKEHCENGRHLESIV